MSSDSIKTHNEFAREFGITFPLISDPGKKIQQKYGRGRITFLIDKKGVVRYIQKGVPKNKKILKKIKKLD